MGLGAQDFFYESQPDGLMRGAARLLPIGSALLILGIQHPVDHQLCGDIRNVIVQF